MPETDLIAVVDVETTGISETDQVVEWATVTVPGGLRFRAMVQPTVPISLEARAVHHITDAELEGCWPMSRILNEETSICGEGATVMAAHNLEFDLRMLLQSGVPREALPARTVCTWRCALHLYPDSPAHSNQVLRYYLGLEVPPVDEPPHRALPDAVVTAALLERMLTERSLAELEALTGQPALLARVPFGKSRGRPWAEMDRGFCLWVLDPRQTFNSDVKHTARHWAQRMGAR